MNGFGGLNCLNMKGKESDFEREERKLKTIIEQADKLNKKGFSCEFVGIKAEAILFKDQKDNYNLLVLKDGKYCYSISRVDKAKVMDDIARSGMADIEDAFYKYKVSYSKQNEELEKEVTRMLDDYTENIVNKNAGKRERRHN